MNFKIKGVFSALVTPFFKGEIDFESLEKLVRFQVDHGVHGLVINGTTGESPNLEKQEVKKIFQHVRQVVGPNYPLILGTGSNSTLKTQHDSALAKEYGAQAVLVVVPYYNKPSQKGLIQHFNAVADAATAPVILYNVPGRTITAMAIDTVVELSKHQNICGIKEASGDLKYDLELMQKCGGGFVHLSGDDGTYLDYLKIGGQGVISVMSNLIPAESVKWTEQMWQGHQNEARADFARYTRLINLMYSEANPIPVKWMLYKAGLIRSAEMRLPLTELDQRFHEEITKEMHHLGLLK